MKRYAELIGAANVYATVRSAPKPGSLPDGVNVIEGIDVSKKDCGDKIVDGLQGKTVQVVIYVSGILKPEVSYDAVHSDDEEVYISDANQEFGKSNWDDQVAMYTICSIAPVSLPLSLFV